MTKPESADQHEKDPSRDSTSSSSRASAPWADQQASDATSDGSSAENGPHGSTAGWDEDGDQAPSEGTAGASTGDSRSTAEASGPSDPDVRIATVGEADAESARPESLASVTALHVVPDLETEEQASPEEQDPASVPDLASVDAGTEERHAETPSASASDEGTAGASENSASEDATPEPVSTPEVDDELLLERWLHQVDIYTGPDALLDFNLVDNVHIDLTSSNPSGYAQLLAGRKTRL